jgi:hypothetical protein
MEDPGKPPSPALECPKERRPPRNANVREGIEDGAGIARLAHLEHDLTHVHSCAGLQGARRDVGHGEILTELPCPDRPAFRPQVSQDLLTQEQNCLIRVPVRLLGPPPVEIALDTLGCDREKGHRSLGKSASPPLPGLEMKLNNATLHASPRHGHAWRPTVSTTPNRAFPLIMRSYASEARSRGKVSLIDRTPVRALKTSVSCESIDVPAYRPLIERRPPSNDRGETCSERAAPTIRSVPLTARPPVTAIAQLRSVFPGSSVRVELGRAAAVVRIRKSEARAGSWACPI